MSERKRTLERVQQVWDTGQSIRDLPKETWMELSAMFDIKVCDTSAKLLSDVIFISFCERQDKGKVFSVRFHSIE